MSIKHGRKQYSFQRCFLCFVCMNLFGLLLLTQMIQAGQNCDLYARSALLLDASNGRVLLEKNGYEVMPMASTTKIMTCILALEYMEDHPERVESENVVASKEACKMPKVRLGMCQGEEFRLADLLYSLMLESHNDTAVAIAEYIDGDVERFAVRMNEKAVELGCNDTYFVTPNGLDGEKSGKIHGTTAYDLARIARYAIQNEKFNQIVGTKQYQFRSLNLDREFICYNHNQFLDMMDGAFGIKTGFTNDAGYCFVGALERDGSRYIGVVLGSGWPPNKDWKWKDIKTLMTYGLEKYEKKCIMKEHNLKPVHVIGGVEEKVPIGNLQTEKENDLTLLLSEEDKVDCKVCIETEIQAPVKKGKILGYVEYDVNGIMYKRYEIVAKKSIKLRTYSYCMRQIFMLYF